MNIIRSTLCRICRMTSPRSVAVDTSASCQRLLSSWVLSRTAPGSQAGLLFPSPAPEGSGALQQPPHWSYQQVRTKKRGTEYQPKNIKRKRTHGWIKRLSSRGGIEVILRRMLKGRKSLTH